MDDLAATLMRRLGVLRALRSEHEDVWRDCGDHSFPIRSTGFYGERETTAGLAGKQARLYDSTATDAGRTLASAKQTGTTPANSRWFGLQVWGENDAEASALDTASETLWQAIHASNFDAESAEGQLDSVAFGWFVMFIDTRTAPEGSVDGFHFQLWPVAQCFCAASQPGGLIDTLFRPHQMSAEQIVSKFGLDAVSERVRTLYVDGKQDEKIDLLHAIYPRLQGREGAVRAKNMPFASVYIECDTRTVLRESGFHEQPFVAPRWTRIPGSVYAVGPMFDALPDVKTLNEMAKTELANWDMSVYGMWVAEDDGVLNPRTLKVGARKIVVANSVESIKQIKDGANLNANFTKRADLESKIRKVMMADQLPPMEGQPRTAAEIYARINLIRQLLGPVYGRDQAEYLQPLLQRCFGLALRAGLFSLPASLQGRPYTITYLSPMAKAQKLEEVSAIESTVQSVGLVAQAKQDPSVWDLIDVDESVRVAADGRGMPARLVRAPDDVAKLRAQRQQDQQAAQQQQMEQAMQQEIGTAAAQAGVERLANAA